MSLSAQDAAAPAEGGARRPAGLRRLRPGIGAQFFLIFMVLAIAAVANWLVVDRTLAQLRGTAALVNVTGSLRWLSQRIELGTTRVVVGLARDPGEVRADLARLEDALRALEGGGTSQGFAIDGLPAGLREDMRAIRRAGAELARDAEALLDGSARGTQVSARQARLHENGKLILEEANALAAVLTRESLRIEDHALVTLLRLGLLDAAILVALLLAVRRQVVVPLRRLAAASRAYAREGRTATGGDGPKRADGRSRDEIGEVALAFHDMAAQIGRDLEQIAAGAVELRDREAGLRKFRSAVEHSPVSVMMTDAEGRIEYANPRFCAISGYAPAEVLGRKPSILKSGQTSPRTYEDMWQTLLAGREWHGELINRRKDGSLFWEETSVAPVKDERGRVTHFVAVKEDVSARKRAEAAMLNLNAELERRVAVRTRQLAESNRELESFSYSVSHDLRAPLRAINGYASLMAENCKGCGRGEALDYMARMRQASVRMGSLIDDLLELSRVGRKEIAFEPLDLSGLAHSVLGELKAADPGRRVFTEIQDGLMVAGEASLLRAALENLLGNAWKFTARRAPGIIGFGCVQHAGERVFCVSDNGAGFDMRYVDKLFGAFQRLHAAGEFEGNGIGLAMVRRIIALHGGRIWAEGAVDAGARFYFTLPGMPPDRPAPISAN